MSWGLRTGSALLLLALAHNLWVGVAQEAVLSETDCVNGELVYNVGNNQSTTCQCYPGWSGTQCSLCRGRIRLTDSSGIIADDVFDMNYTKFTQCLFYVEANESVSSIHLKIHFLHMECQWDYLHVFDGDSLFSLKIASYTGDIIEHPPILPSTINITSNYNVSDTTVLPLVNPQHTLSSSGPKVLLFFYADAAIQGPGFELAYWVDYECPDFCSGRGQCDNSTGTCSCDPDWTGEACHVPVCPNNCSGNGVCDVGLSSCVCSQGYQGEDCSVEVSNAHWSMVSYSSSLPPSTLARTGHSAVMWDNTMIVYGGYRFPYAGSVYSGTGPGGRGSGVEPGVTVSDDVLRYRFDSNAWDVLNTSAAAYAEEEVMEPEGGSGTGVGRNKTVVRVPLLPAPRYGHSAVVYNGSMYVFGGSLYPSEAISSELWTLDLTSFQWTPLFNMSTDLDNSSVNPVQLPVAVRGHTAHMVGSKMVVLFGFSQGEETFPAYIQEYDFTSGVWSVPEQHGVSVTGRMGHSSVYSQEAGLVYVHGGRGNGFKLQLLSYDPICHVWTSLAAPRSPVQVRYLHSSFLLGPLLLSFGGCQGHASNRDCFSHDLLVYNTVCNSWETVELPGLPTNASRYGHTSLVEPRPQGQRAWSVTVFGGFVGTTRLDMLRLLGGNCSQWVDEEECVNASGLLCAWRRGEELCVSVTEVMWMEKNVSFSCAVESCLSYLNSSSCLSADGCMWRSSQCLPENGSVPGTSCPPPTPPTELCSNLTSCESCQLYGCYWGSSREMQVKCFPASALDDPVLNITVFETCTGETCFSHTNCNTCVAGPCLWCPSLSQCIFHSTYPIAFNFGQCLGWVDSCEQSQCQGMTNCSSCQELPQCGWCNDPSDTGLGQCSLGGFGGPQNDSFCLEADALGNQEEWQFYQCSACQCNGHSTCANSSSSCEQCGDNTSGQNCETCSTGYFGIATNGGPCAECDCNGYDLACNTVTGACVCESLGVSGEKCTNCTGDYGNGDADNICYADLAVGFIYTFRVTLSNEVQGFYAVTPTKDENLHFKFEMTANPFGLPVFIQLFLGRKSQNLWVLSNLTDRVPINARGSYDGNYDSFSSSVNMSDPMLVSFTHPVIRDSSNFSAIFEAAVENDYTGYMWDGDVTLVMHVTNLRSPSTFRITVDQQNYIYLLYFFATFVTCFSVLLTAFLLIWFIKKKLAMRAYMRRQYIELQRRVARPFAKIKLQVENTPLSSSPLPTDQNPSYVGVEACRDDKAAVLSLLVRLPGDHKSGRPPHGRSGLCLGSTLVYVNSSKKPKQKKKTPLREEGRNQGARVRDGANSYLVHTGRARQRHFSDSQLPVTVEDV